MQVIITRIQLTMLCITRKALPSNLFDIMKYNVQHKKTTFKMSITENLAMNPTIPRGTYM